MPDDSFGPDLPFFHKKIKFGFYAHRRGERGGDEEASYAEITDTGNIISSFTAPNDPNVFYGFGARNHPTGIGKFCKCGGHHSPLAVRAWAGLAND
jgi:hypothetical protein